MVVIRRVEHAEDKMDEVKKPRCGWCGVAVFKIVAACSLRMPFACEYLVKPGCLQPDYRED